LLRENNLYLKHGYTSAKGNFAVQLQQLLPVFHIGEQDQWAYFDGKWSESAASTGSHTCTSGTTTVVAMPTRGNSRGLVTVALANHARA